MRTNCKSWVELTCLVLGLTAGYIRGLIPQALSNRGQQPQLADDEIQTTSGNTKCTH